MTARKVDLIAVNMIHYGDIETHKPRSAAPGKTFTVYEGTADALVAAGAATRVPEDKPAPKKAAKAKAVKAEDVTEVTPAVTADADGDA